MITSEKKLLQVRQQERANISRELHDNLGQLLTGLRFDMCRLTKKTAKIELPQFQEIHNDTQQVLTYVDTIIQSVRQLAQELRPTFLDELGLLMAIERLLKDFQTKTNILCQFHTELSALQIDKSYEVDVYRILQESLTNIARHANASHIIVTVAKSCTNYTITVTDDGIGIADHHVNDITSLGILNMHERTALFDGMISISGNPDKGSVISLHIPISTP